MRCANEPSSCAPEGGSAESCSVDLSAPGVVHVMVRGYASSSTFDLVGSEQ